MTDGKALALLFKLGASVLRLAPFWVEGSSCRGLRPPNAGSAGRAAKTESGASAVRDLFAVGDSPEPNGLSLSGARTGPAGAMDGPAVNTGDAGHGAGSAAAATSAVAAVVDCSSGSLLMATGAGAAAKLPNDEAAGAQLNNEPGGACVPSGDGEGGAQSTAASLARLVPQPMLSLKDGGCDRGGGGLAIALPFAIQCAPASQQQ